MGERITQHHTTLPNFFVIGAMRSGSSSLYRYLREHPEVFMRHKEIQFFDRYWDRGVDWYRSLFEGAEGYPAVGEATPNYMCDPTALDRMAETVPDARLLAILRNPIDRAYSHYWMEHTRGRDPRTFEEAVTQEIEHGPPAEDLPPRDYLRRSRYITHLEQVGLRFDRTALHVVLLDELRADAASTYAAMCHFLHIDENVRPDVLGRPVNHYVHFRSRRLRKMSNHLPQALNLRRIVTRLNVAEAEYPPMRPDTGAQLTEHFAEDNAALARWLDRDLSAWA